MKHLPMTFNAFKTKNLREADLVTNAENVKALRYWITILFSYYNVDLYELHSKSSYTTVFMSGYVSVIEEHLKNNSRSKSFNHNNIHSI